MGVVFVCEHCTDRQAGAYEEGEWQMPERWYCLMRGDDERAPWYFCHASCLTAYVEAHLRPAHFEER